MNEEMILTKSSVFWIGSMKIEPIRDIPDVDAAYEYLGEDKT